MTRVGITALIPTAGKDVVAIFKQSDVGDDEVILESAHLINATVDEHATFFKHPLETGQTLVDHRIIEPVTIELQVILVDSVSVVRGLISGGDFITRVRDTYDEIRQLYENGTFLSIQTRTATYRNQILQSMPHEETSSMFDGVALSFNTSEIQFETPTLATPPPAETEDTDTVTRGKQNALALATDVGEGILDRAKSIFGV